MTVLEEDRFRWVGSATDDLRAWFTAGGPPHVKKRFFEQARDRGLEESHREEIAALVDTLLKKHRSRILTLMASGVIPVDLPSIQSVSDLDLSEVSMMIDQMQSGERPFEDWMRAHGHSDDDIAKVYASIDAFLVRRGIFSTPPPPWLPEED